MLNWQAFQKVNWILWLLSIFGQSVMCPGVQRRLGMLKKIRFLFQPNQQGYVTATKRGSLAFLMMWIWEAHRARAWRVEEFPNPVVNVYLPWTRLSRCWTCLHVVLWSQLLNLRYVKSFWSWEVTKHFSYLVLAASLLILRPLSDTVVAAGPYNVIIQTL